MTTSAVFTHQMLSIARLTPGRRLWVLHQMHTVAQARGLSFLLDRIQEAIAHDRHTLSINTAWSATPRNQLYSRRVTELSRMCSRCITGMRDMALAQARGRRPGDTHAALVKAFLSEAFPNGVGAITSLPYADHVAALEGIIDTLRGPLAAMVSELALGRQVEHLYALVAEYRDAIRESLQVVTYEEVRATRQKGQELLCAIVALVMGMYYNHESREHAEARAALLGPVLIQDAAIRAYLSSRRSVRDINPDTGEVEAEAPAGADKAGDTAAAAGAPQEDRTSAHDEPPEKPGMQDVEAAESAAGGADPVTSRPGQGSRPRRRRKRAGLRAKIQRTAARSPGAQAEPLRSGPQLSADGVHEGADIGG